MKRTILCTLVSLGTIFGSTSALLAGNPADAIPVPAQGDTAASAAPADTLTVLAAPAPSVAEAKTDSLLQLLDQRLADLEQSVTQVRNMSYSHSEIDGQYVMVVLVVALIAAALVIMTFAMLKYRYRRRVKIYELERLRIERGEQLPVPEQTEVPLTIFVRRLLVTGIIGFVILAWVGVVNLSYMRFFSSILLWALIAGVGYAVVYLFRLYVQRRDENR
ncbi:MAG: DUF3597 domain-containing protein [Rikenellaceae bacterium]|nr:DUF3597 domain-containing protein [Rikenellaceae bacterium]